MAGAGPPRRSGGSGRGHARVVSRHAVTRTCLGSRGRQCALYGASAKCVTPSLPPAASRRRRGPATAPPGCGSVPPNATVSGPAASRAPTTAPVTVRPTGTVAGKWPRSSAPSLFSWSPTPCRRRAYRSIRPECTNRERFRRGRSNAYAARGRAFAGHLPDGQTNSRRNGLPVAR